MKNAISRCRTLLLLVGSLCGALGVSQAATINATSCNVAAVSSAIDAAANGDTVVIPNGSCTWSSGISTSKQITIRGASVGGVTITHGAGSGTLLNLSVGSSSRTRVSNLRFMPGSGTGVYIDIGGSGLGPLMSDVYFNIPNFQLAHAVRWYVSGGVIWRATFESTDNGGSDSGCLQVKGSIPWIAQSTMGVLDSGGTNNLYIEDSSFLNVGQCPDVDELARVVVRRSKIVGSSGLTHGTTSYEGGRQVELYDNTFTYPDQNRNLNRYFWFRAGTAVITRNSVQQISGQMYGNKSSFVFAVENAQRGSARGCCTGYMCFHQPGSGGNGSTQIAEPVYIWGNTGSGIQSVSTNNGEPNTCNTGYSTDDFFKPNRDYFVENGGKPGYTSYQYPHPLTQGSAAPPAALLPAPVNLRVQ